MTDHPTLSSIIWKLGLTALAALVAIAFYLVPTHASADEPISHPTVVLVHGAWADSSVWDGVILRLERAGYPVDVVPTPLRGLASDSAFLVDYLKSISGPIVLVGHSFGGAVVTNAATGNSNVKALVYDDAFTPDQGESVLQLDEAQPGACVSGGGDPTKVFNFVTDPALQPGDYDLYVKTNPDGPFPGYAACFANDLPPIKASLLAATQRPLTLSSFFEKSGPPAWKTIPSWFFIGTEDHVIPPAEQLYTAQRAHGHIVEAPASHLSMISHPDEVAAVIIAAATATSQA